MKSQTLVMFFLIISSLGYTQDNISKYPNFIGQNIDEIKSNKNWKILRKSSGNLNTDGLIDHAIILESKGSIPEKRCDACELTNNKTRIILILINNNGEERVTIQNNKFIARGNEGVVTRNLKPKLTIENGLMTIHYTYVRSIQEYIFKFNDSRMVIITAKSFYSDPNNGYHGSDKYDFKKGELTIKSEAPGNNITEVIEFNVEPKSLSQFQEMYEWEIVENKYL